MHVKVGAFLAIASIALAVSACQGGSGVDMPDGMVSTEVGPEGGTVRSFDGNLTIVLPAGALSEPTLISIGVSTDAPASIGPAYRVQPNVDLAMDSEVTYRYAPSDVQGRVIAFSGRGRRPVGRPVGLPSGRGRSGLWSDSSHFTSWRADRMRRRLC